MLKTFFLPAAFLVTTIVSAQTKPFVEVVVEDTMQLDAEEIVYAVSYAHWYTTSDTVGAAIDFDTVATVAIPPKPTIDRLKEVRQIIQLMKLDTLRESNYAVLSREEFEQSAILVQFRSAARLKEFVNQIKNIADVRGAIVTTKSSQARSAEKILFQRLFDQAKAKAETLAKIAGKKLGAIVSIREKEIQGGWTMYPPLSTIPGWHSEVSREQSGRITLHSGLIVQFNWQ